MRFVVSNGKMLTALRRLTQDRARRAVEEVAQLLGELLPRTVEGAGGLLTAARSWSANTVLPLTRLDDGTTPKARLPPVE